MPHRPLLTIGLIVVLAISYCGNAHIATFCAAGLGADCCAMHHHSGRPEDDSTYGKEMRGTLVGVQGSAMGMSMDHESTNKAETDDPNSAADESGESVQAITDELFSQSSQWCTHCLIHSGRANPPLSAIGSITNENSVAVDLLPVSNSVFVSVNHLEKYHFRRDHAPPGSNASRYILINLFLI